MAFLFCHTKWMEEYRGEKGSDHETYDYLWEACNFLPCPDGHVYGYCPPGKGNIRLERIHDECGQSIASENNPSVNGIDVIWTATDPKKDGRYIVGFYHNATVYRNFQKYEKYPSYEHEKNNIGGYRIKAPSNNAVLFDHQKRTIEVPQMGRYWSYANEDRHKQFLEYLNNLIDNNIQSSPDEIQQRYLYEGAKQTIVVNRYERNASARMTCITEKGTKCIVCGFDFKETYGKIGEGFIHVHHLVPLNEIGENYKIDPIEDLVPICPNCHSMIHKQWRNKTLTIDDTKTIIDEFKDFLKKNAATI